CRREISVDVGYDPLGYVDFHAHRSIIAPKNVRDAEDVESVVNFF
ncbi:unnamed protein product, partial [Oikopleura dioica]